MAKNNINTLQKSVLATLAYYKTVKTPLTLVQIGRYLVEIDCVNPGIDINQSLQDIKNVLDNLNQRGIIVEQKGLYWLKSWNTKHVSSKNWLKFIQLEKTAQRKINKVRKALKIFSVIPFLRAMFICGSVARRVSRPESDIDFLVLAKKNRVWTVRFLLTVFAFLLGKKTSNAGSRKNKFCLNHYRSSSHLKLEKNLQDLYSAQEYARMVNIYSNNKIENKFFQRNKEWIKKYLPNFNFSKPPLSVEIFTDSIPFKIKSKLENMLAGKTGNLIEKLLSHLQAGKIKFSGYRLSLNKQRIVTDSNVIMFHLNPRAPVVLISYNKIIRQINTYDY